MSKKTKLSAADDNFLREIAEDVKNDNLKKLWDKYGLFVVLFVAVVLAVAVSYESIKNWRNKGYEELSNAFAVAMSLETQGRYEESLSLLQQIVDKKGIYSELARLQMANVRLAQGKTEEAAALLQNLVDDDDLMPELKDVAAVKLASYKLDNAPRAEVEALLQPLAGSNGKWSPIAKEMLALLELREGNVSAAQTLYREIADTPEIPDSLKVRARDMLSIISDPQN